MGREPTHPILEGVATKRELAEAEETPQTKLAHFELADQEGRWQPASAVIKDRTVKVTSESVPHPVAVRYAYAVSPQGCNLYNRDGLPASPFRTDDWDFEP